MATDDRVVNKQAHVGYLATNQVSVVSAQTMAGHIGFDSVLIDNAHIQVGWIAQEGSVDVTFDKIQGTFSEVKANLQGSFSIKGLK